MGFTVLSREVKGMHELGAFGTAPVAKRDKLVEKHPSFKVRPDSELYPSGANSFAVLGTRKDLNNEDVGAQVGFSSRITKVARRRLVSARRRRPRRQVSR